VSEEFIRRWWPDDHTLARLERVKQVDGHYPGCRHYAKTGEHTFHCTRHLKEKRECSGCMTCPNCGGMMYTHKMRKDIHREHIYITHEKSCSLCGAYIEEQYIKIKPQEQKAARHNKCQVEGCKHTAWEGYRTTDEIPAMQVFIICEAHRRRIKTWRLNSSKGPEHIPVVVISRKLYENTNYWIKQGHKKS
jgi:hypothetical protein